MKTALAATAAAAAMATTMWATPTRACSPIEDNTWGHFTFGYQTVPRNAELFITRFADIVDDDDTFALVAPDGTVIDADLERAGSDGRIVVDVPLSAGAWLLRINHPADEFNEPWSDEIPFEVTDDEDLDAPAAPIVTVKSTTVGGAGPLNSFLFPCGPNDRTTYRSISISLDEADSLARVAIDGVTYNVSGGYVEVGGRIEDGSDVVVSSFDFAGNESVVVVATVEGGSCASVSAVPSSLLALGLLLRRRRARAS